MGTARAPLAPDGRGRQQEIEYDWEGSLLPYAGTVLSLECCCGSVLEDLTPIGWTVGPPAPRPFRTRTDPQSRPEVVKTVTAGRPPGYLLAITYEHHTRKCERVHRLRGEQLAFAFIETAEAGACRIRPWGTLIR